MKKIEINPMKLEALNKKGLNPVEIAVVLGTTEGTIRNRLKELGLVRNSKIKDITIEMQTRMEELNKEGRTNQEIATILSTTPATVRKHLRRKNLKFNSTKKYTLTKQVLELSPEQLEVLYGSLLGDMSIDLNWKNARPIITHGGNQWEYFKHKCTVFKDLIGKPCTTPRFDKRTMKYYKRYTVKFLTNPLYTKLKEELYPNGIKTVTQEWLDKITPRGLAYWFMDDGCNSGIIATNSFSLEECKLIQQWFYDKWGVECSIRKQVNNKHLQYLLYIKTDSRAVFSSLIEPYVIPSMKYKLNWNQKLGELRETP
jgi:LAGLIDADG homing endonuclease|uniref:Endonuclease n=1 Tax=Podoviridae sp. ctz6O13 TaxID=2827757 RepID=A0A8S5TK23_9CAUD|nr:MAG TPA: endonuclease [Podoviridae sp. ctz6O13]